MSSKTFAAGRVKSKQVPAYTNEPTSKNTTSNIPDAPRAEEKTIEVGTGLDILGPVQYQTFAYSEVSDTETFDPNLWSLNLHLNHWWLYPGIDVGIGILGRVTRSYENTVTRTFSGTGESVIRRSSVGSTGYGFAQGIRRGIEPDHIWVPGISMIEEYSRVDLHLDQPASSQSSAIDVGLRSELLLAYLRFDSTWMMRISNVLCSIGLDLKIPFWRLNLSHYDSAQEHEIQGILNHRTNPGIGFNVSFGRKL